MKTLGTKGLRFLKICHLLFAIMWIGGVQLYTLAPGASAPHHSV